MASVRLSQLNRTLMWILIGISILGGALWCWNTPLCLDDYTYNKVPREYTYGSLTRCDGRPVESLADAFEAMDHVRATDNGRLANFLHILLTTLPEDVERVLNALALGLMTLLMCMLTGLRNRPTPVASALTLIGIWLVLPWYSGLQSLVFQMNYIWGGAMMCAAVLLWPGREKLRPLALSAYIALMFVLGWWHEGFAIVVIVLLGVDLAVNGRRNPRRGMLLIASLILGVLANLIFGTLHRILAHEGRNSNVGHMSELLTGIFTDLWPVATALILMMLVAARRPDMRRPMLPWAAALAVAVAMPFALQMYERTFWPALMLSIIINVWMFRSLFRLPVRLTAVVLAAMVVCSAWWFAELNRYECAVRKQWDSYNAQLEAYRAQGRPCNVVYGSTGGSDAVPWYLFGIPDAFQESYEGMFYLANNYGLHGTMVLALPDSLQGRTFDQLPAYQGNSNLRGVWPTLLTRDSVSVGTIMVSVAPPRGNMHLFYRLLAAASGDTREASYPLAAWRFPVTMPDGEQVWAYFVVKRPRTKRWRDILSVDVTH